MLPRQRTIPASLFTAALAEGDAVQAEGCAHRLLADGMPLPTLYDLVTRTLEEVGVCWELGTKSVVDEHRATAAAFHLVARLRDAPPHDVHGTVILTTVSGERHVLALEVLAHLFEVSGYRAVVLGDVPARDLAETVRGSDLLRAVLFSAHVPRQRVQLRSAVEAVRGVRPAVPVIVGGPGVSGEVAADLGVDCVGATAYDALTSVEAISADVRRRRRS